MTLTKKVSPPIPRPQHKDSAHPAGRKSGFRNPDSRHTPTTSQQANAADSYDITKACSTEVLEKLSNELKQADIRSQAARIRIVAEGYNVALQLKDNPRQLDAFRSDKFWTEELLPSKGPRLLRQVLLRILGSEDLTRKASEWTTPLKDAFMAGEPAASVPAILKQHARTMTAKRKDRTAKRTKNIEKTEVSLPRTRGVVLLSGVTSEETTIRFKADRSCRILILQLPVRKGTKPSNIVRIPPRDPRLKKPGIQYAHRPKERAVGTKMRLPMRRTAVSS